jgi:multidrug efflux pump subunit AcrB
MNLTTFSVKNRQFTTLLFVMIAITGVLTFFTMPRAEDPQINPPNFFLTVIYPGTSPADLEELVVKPIENKIYELENIDKILTTIEDNLVIMEIVFLYGESINDKYQEVVREINALQGKLPQDIASINIVKADPSDVNILQIALISENASARLMKFHADKLKEQLEKITELKKIEVSGASEEIIRIDLKLDKLAALNIPVNLVVASLQSELGNIPGGNITLGTKSFNIKTSGKYQELEEIAGTVVFNANGTIIYLRDVATVGFQNSEEKHITRVNGYRAILLSAAQKPGANISSTQKRYLPVLEEFAESLPENISMIRYFDQADNVSRRLAGLGRDFLFAISLVLITLLPLGLRASFVVMIAIPLSLSLGLAGLYFFGYSLNQLSIVGLVLALGLLVDDSIVVVENIERWLRDGFSRTQAAVKATMQITIPSLIFTATLIISFMPLAFLPGIPGEFIRTLPVAVIATVTASFLISLTIVPFLSSYFLKEPVHSEGNRFYQLLRTMVIVSSSRLVIKALKRPALTLMIVMAIFVSSLMLFPAMGFKLFPASEKPIFMINIHMPLQTSLQESDRITRLIEDSLKGNPHIKYYTANIGKGNPQVYYNEVQQQEKSDFAQIFVQMDEKATPAQKNKLIGGLRNQFALFPYARVEVKDFEQGPPIEAPVSVRILGENLDTLRSFSYEVERILRSHPGTVYVNNELNVQKSDIRVNINREKARTLGVFTADIDRTVRLAVAGFTLGTYTDTNGNDFDILINAPRENFATLDVFDNLYVNNAAGTPIPFSQIASLEMETSSGIINHLNKTRFVKVTSFTRENVLANDVLRDVVPLFDQMHLPQGYYWQLAGEAENEENAFGGNFMIVILLTVFLFVAVLLFQFKTMKGILIVLSVIPLSITGGIALLWLTGNPMSFVAIIGFIGLTGIAIKSSILYVDYVNELREQGMDIHEAILEAGEVKYLPVVLTAMTTIGGFTPLALNTNPLISPLAIVVIGGLISSTLLSRLVIPVMYKLLPPEIEVREEK